MKVCASPSGDREPSIDVLKRLADYYDVSVDYLVGRDLIERASLSVYEKELVDSSRKSCDFVRESILEIFETLNRNFDKKGKH